MQEEFRVTEAWLCECGVGAWSLELFREYVPGGSCSVQDFLKRCEEPEFGYLCSSWVKDLPENTEPLVLEEYTGGNIHYNGHVHIKKGFTCDSTLACRSLTVDGTLTLGKGVISVNELNVQVFNYACDGVGSFMSFRVNADEININGNSHFHVRDVNARVINIQGSCLFWVNNKINAEEIKLSEWASIYSDEVDTGLIGLQMCATVYANKITTNEINIISGGPLVFVHDMINVAINPRGYGGVKIVEHPFDLRLGMHTYLTNTELKGTIWERF